MFGYLRIKKCQMDADSRADHRSYFCAGCHALADQGGKLTSLLTNYDQTFLLTVAAGLARTLEPPTRRAPRKPCTALPFVNVGVASIPEPIPSYVAACTIALVDAKLQDDILDDHPLRGRAGRWLLRSKRANADRVLAGHNFPAHEFDLLAVEQGAAEAAEYPTAESLTDPTARLLGRVFGHVAELVGESQHVPSLRSLGESLGRLIVVADALEDRHEDRRRGRFNLVEALGTHASIVPNARGLDLAAFVEREIVSLRRALTSLPLHSVADALAGATVNTLEGKLRRDLQVSPAMGDQPEYANQRGACDACDCCTTSCDCADCCDIHYCCEACADCLCCWGEARDDRRRGREARRAKKRTERDARRG